MYPKGMAGFKRFIDLLDVEPEINDREHAKSVTHLQGENAFEQVTFGYEKAHEPVIRSIDLKINAGERVANVGQTEAGKKKISARIQRFYDVDQHELTCNHLVSCIYVEQ